MCLSRGTPGLLAFLHYEMTVASRQPFQRAP